MKDQSNAIEVRQVAPNDIAAVERASALFNRAPTAEGARRFLDDGKNVLLFACLDGEPVGFARAVYSTVSTRRVASYSSTRLA